jgi:hypothetical protein
MVDREETMYGILGAISAMDAPIVFKGALITKLVLTENGFFSALRQTKDIDASWVGETPTMGGLVDAINRALTVFDGAYLAVAIREHSEKQTAGISIVSAATEKEVVSMDIGVKPVSGSRLYHYGELEIRGVLPNEILADKISVLSGRYIFRRAKDLFDVYAIAHCVRVANSEIYDVQRMNGCEFGAFSEFLSRRRDVEHAYARLKGIEDKPDFDEVYAYLEKFLSPFIQKNQTPAVWNIDTSEWNDTSQTAIEKW